jgi:exopolysaccharide biosynthesis polyprenyl glycosylphosphotransferase
VGSGAHELESRRLTQPDGLDLREGAVGRRRGRVSVLQRVGTRLSLALIGVDVAALLLAGICLKLDFASRGAASPPSPVEWFATFGFLVLVQFAVKGTYARKVRPELIEDARAIIVATTLATMTTLTLRVFLAHSAAFPDELREEGARLWVYATVYLIAGRTGLRLRQLGRSEAAPAAPTLIVGAGQVGHRLAQRLLRDPKSELRPIGYLDKEPLDPARLELPVLGGSWDLERVVHAFSVEHVLISFSTAPTQVVIDLIRRCERLGVSVSIVPRLFESTQGRMEVDYFGALPLLTIHRNDPNGWAFRFKYALDRIFALVALILLAPVFIAVACAVLVSLGRPVFFRQERVGKDGKIFDVLKFRSMSNAPPEQSGQRAMGEDEAPGGVEGADRRTRVGAFIRKTSLDELPQLINALRGEMSIVGPRPERPEYVARFEERIPRYGDRHRVKVGITGWSQIHGLRGRTSLSDRVEWDNFYIENWSPWLDLKIVLLTIVAVIKTARIAA